MCPKTENASDFLNIVFVANGTNLLLSKGLSNHGGPQSCYDPSYTSGKSQLNSLCSILASSFLLGLNSHYFDSLVWVLYADAAANIKFTIFLGGVSRFNPLPKIILFSSSSQPPTRSLKCQRYALQLTRGYSGVIGLNFKNVFSLIGSWNTDFI